MIAGAAAIGGIIDTVIAGAPAFEVVENSDAGDALALLRVATFRCASANGIAQAAKSRTK
jgi:hypothetical protein